MKYIITLLLVIVLVPAIGLTQSIVKIHIVKKDSVKISFLNNTTSVAYEQLNFGDGNGKFIIENSTDNNNYILKFLADGNQQFTISSNKIPVSSTRQFNISSTGEIDGVSNSALTKKLKITVINSDNQPISGFVSASAPAEVPDVPVPTPRRPGSTTKKEESTLLKHVSKRISEEGYRYVPSQNILIDNKGIIHIFLDKDLKPIYSYFPTTAKERYDKYQFHIIAPKEYTYSIESDGELTVPPLSDDISEFPKVQSAGAVEYIERILPIMGPYSGNFDFVIERYKDDKPDGFKLERTIKQLKVSRVSLDISAVCTWLRNPENITIFVRPEGDSTLVADNPNVRGMLGAFLTFHFKPRNLGVPPRNFSERLGISFGTALSEKIGDNFFLGLNIEVANGLFFNGGAHFGQVNYPINFKEFDYGSEKFTGTLVTRKRWDVNAYAAVSIDMGLFMKAFKNLLGTQSPNE